MTDPKSPASDVEADLEAEREISKELDERLKRLEDEVSPPEPKPDHAYDGGIL
jgi:hypothetical protein